MRRALSSGWSLPSLKDLHDPDMGMKVGARFVGLVGTADVMCVCGRGC